MSDSLGRLAVDELLRLLPDEPLGFSGSQFAAPVRSAILGDKPLDLGSLRRELIAKSTAGAKDLLSPLLLAAEAIEAARDDKQDYFIDDAAAQGLVFMGAKWQAGWAMVLGCRHTPELLEELKRREYLVFTDQPGIADTQFIGDRPTSPIYFLQLMVRYGLIWGGIAPGDDHELGHFLEDDLPGLLIVTEDLPPLKYLVTLGLMKLGAPAVVPSSFPFPYGNRVVAGRFDGSVLLWEFAWDYEFPSLADWDEGARSYLETFLALHTPPSTWLFGRKSPPEWTENDFRELIVDLRNRGFGWIRPAGIQRKLDELAANMGLI